MPYVVINEFKDTKDNGTHYKVGETYPKGNFKPTKKRIEELSSIHPKYNRAFIQEIVEKEEKEDKKKPSSEK